MVEAIRLTILATCASLVCCAATAQAEPSASVVDDMSHQQNSAMPLPTEITKPMKMDEPMEGKMMREGMKKGEVKDSADKKDKKMKKMLEIEEKSMPPMPQQTPQTPGAPKM